MGATTRMSNADAAWLRMDQPTNYMIITSVLWFDEPVTRPELEEVLRDRLLARFPRFGWRAELSRRPGAHARWRQVDVDLAAHVEEVTLVAPGGRHELEALVSEIISTDLDRTRPLWRNVLVHNYRGGSALVSRVHHSVADGITLARVLLSLSDEATQQAELGSPPTPSGDGRRAAHHLGLGRTAAHEGIEVLRHPSRALDLADLAGDTVRAAGKLVLTPPDRRTVLKGRLGTIKAARWIDPVPLAQVRDFARDRGATINDVLVAAVTGALRTYLAQRSSLVDDVRVMVPFNLRPLDEPVDTDIGNDFGLIILPLPTGIADPDERLAEVHRRMEHIKHSPEAPVSYGILQAMGRSPQRVEHALIELFAAKVSGVVTNVPGPRQARHIAGRRIAGVLPWVPQSGHIGLGVSLFSYAGEVNVGVAVDRRLIPDVDVLMAAFDSELGRTAGR